MSTTMDDADDLLIRHALVFDGSGADPAAGDVRVVDQVGKLEIAPLEHGAVDWRPLAEDDRRAVGCQECESIALHDVGLEHSFCG